MALPPGTVPVPLHHQQTSYSCGPAAVLAALRYWKKSEFARTREAALYGPLRTNKDGTDPQPMTDFLNQQQGLHAEYLTGVGLSDLKRAVDRGEPPIVSIQAWRDPKRTQDWTTDWDDGHYLVVIGYDRDNLFFMDPDTIGHYAFIPQGEFMDRWHDIVGPDNVHTDHITIFIRGTTVPFRPAVPPSGKVTRIP